MSYNDETPSTHFKRTEIKAEGCTNCMRRHLNTFDYLLDLPVTWEEEQYVEVQFKHTRKGYYLNLDHIPLRKGDMVAVEAYPGHDIGEVTLTGKLVQRQMKKLRERQFHKRNQEQEPPLKVYRLATDADMSRYREMKAMEQSVMIQSRQIARGLGLEMKISDVEYQGDGQKAIFYYIADGRVDFRQLIKELARAFRIRVEMRQIGVRQEAGRIGGIGPCGRHLCCAGWMTNFVSVGTQAARLQDFSMNPQKLAGQCGKLKCCINFEVDTYCEARQKLPARDIRLETEVGTHKQIKADILSGDVTYVLQGRQKYEQAEPVTISSERAYAIIRANEEGVKPYSLTHDEETFHAEASRSKSKDILETSSLTRFDTEEKKKSNGRRRRRRKEKPQQEETRMASNRTKTNEERRVHSSRNRRRRRSPGRGREGEPNTRSRGDE
ncbi:MAG: regulatory iron-sulfur-containing complex subunit RicT [Porphyromonas sp.]|nr:regulatory iron-sulfur-containing complex subunit RicT [Porphyromonas sp.]